MKILIRLGIGVVLLIVALSIVAQVVVNRPFVREKITKILTEQLHRDVSLSGMSISIFPSIALNLKEFKIGEKDKKQSFASFNTFSIKAKLFPLLKKQVVVKEITLDGAKVNVSKDAKGVFNFSDMISAGAAASNESVAKTASPQSASSANISIDSIRVNDTEFVYQEAMSSGETKTFILQGLNLSIDHFSLDKPIDLKLSCAIGVGAKFSVKGQVGPLMGISGQMEADVEVLLEGLSDNDLTPFLPKEALQGVGFENLHFAGNVKGGLSKGVAGSIELSIRLLPSKKDILFKGSLETKDFGDILFKEFVVKSGSSELGFNGSLKGIDLQKLDLQKVVADLSLSIKIQSDKDFADLMPKDAMQGLGFEKLSVTGKVAGSLSTQMNADLDTSVRLLPAQKDLKLKGALEIKTMNEVALKGLNLTVGSSGLILKGSLKDFNAPKFQIELTSDLLDVNDFNLGQRKGRSSAKAKEEAPAAEEGAENPLYGNSVVQAAQGTFSVNLKKIRIAPNEITDVVVKGKLAAGVLTFDEHSLAVFDGKIKGGSVINLQQKTIGFDTRTDISGISLEKASSANLGEPKIQGTLTGKSAFKGQGLSKSDLERTLSGNANLQIKEGKILGKDLKAEILSKLDNPILDQFLPGLAKLREDAKKEDPSSKNVARGQSAAGVASETRFRDFIVDLTVAGGMANLQKMNMTTDDYKIRGGGTVDFDLQSNLEAHIVFSKTFTERMTGGKDLSDKLPYEDGGLHLAAKITGPLTSPSVRPDLASIVTALTKGQLKDKVGNLLGGKEGKKGGVLGNLLGGSDSSSQGTQQGTQQGTPSSTPSKNPLSNFLGGQNQGESDQQTEDSGNNPLKKLKLF